MFGLYLLKMEMLNQQQLANPGIALLLEAIKLYRNYSIMQKMNYRNMLIIRQL